MALVGADGTRVVALCGSGITACQNLLALEIAGLPGGRLYRSGQSLRHQGDSRIGRKCSTGLTKRPAGIQHKTIRVQRVTLCGDDIALGSHHDLAGSLVTLQMDIPALRLVIYL